VRAATRDGAVPEGLLAKDKNDKTELDRAIDHFKDWKPPAPKPKGVKKPKPAAGEASGAFEFRAYKSMDVKLRLEQMFHGKCAYCESSYSSTAPVDVDHYRPKGAIEGDDKHPGYWWLATAWTNLLPSCIDCNRKRKQTTPIPSNKLLELVEGAHNRGNSRVMNTGKKDSFPISGARATDYLKPDEFAGEKPILLDPCTDAPDDHLDFLVDSDFMICLALPRAEAGAAAAVHLPLAGDGADEADVAADAEARKLSVRGAVSIQVYGLNRLGLVQSRTRVLRRLEFLADLVIELHAIADDVEAANGPIAKRVRQLAGRVISDIKSLAGPKEPHSAVAAAWLRRFSASLSD